MVSGFFVGGFVEFADEFFKTAAHFQIGDDIRVEVDFGEFLNELEEAVGFIELLNLLVEAEVVEESASFGGERLDVVEEVLGETFGVGKELGKVVLAGVVELLLRGAPQHFVDDGGVLAF